MYKERIYDIIVNEAEEGGYWAECPALRGCYAQGESLDEVKKNIQEAIELCIEELQANNKKLPKRRQSYLIPVSLKI